MKDFLRTLVGRATSPVHGRNVAREYLQARILQSLQRAGAMISLAFQGGTALRFLYSIPRYSEDLDFSLERARERYSLRDYLGAISADLSREGYAIEHKLNDRKTVHGAFVRFPGLLHDLSLSGRREEVLAVKLEVDTRPPPGAVLDTTIVRRHVVLHLQHHDKASLFAGKLHALLQRPYLKGRDVFDLVWYLSDPTWPAPNMTLLSAALAQTSYDGPPVTASTWRRVLRERLESTDLLRVRADVEPFLETRADLDLVTIDSLKKLLRG